VTVLHLLEFGDNVLMAGFPGVGETLLEVPATRIDWVPIDRLELR